MKNILKYEDLLKIEEFLRENEMDSGNISIVMDIKTQQRLNRIAADYFHRLNPGVNSDESITELENVNINIGNVLFTYKLNKEVDENQ